MSRFGFYYKTIKIYRNINKDWQLWKKESLFGNIMESKQRKKRSFRVFPFLKIIFIYYNTADVKSQLVCTPVWLDKGRSYWGKKGKLKEESIDWWKTTDELSLISSSSWTPPSLSPAPQEKHSHTLSQPHLFTCFNVPFKILLCPKS